KNKRPYPAPLGRFHGTTCGKFNSACNSLSIKRAVDLLLQPFLDRPPQNLRAKALQQLVQAIDVNEPFPRPTMHNLGQIEKCWLTQLEQLLSLQVAFAAFSRDGRDHGGTMLG